MKLGIRDITETNWIRAISCDDWVLTAVGRSLYLLGMYPKVSLGPYFLGSG